MRAITPRRTANCDVATRLDLTRLPHRRHPPPTSAAPWKRPTHDSALSRKLDGTAGSTSRRRACSATRSATTRPRQRTASTTSRRPPAGRSPANAPGTATGPLCSARTEARPARRHPVRELPRPAGPCHRRPARWATTYPARASRCRARSARAATRKPAPLQALAMGASGTREHRARRGVRDLGSARLGRQPLRSLPLGAGLQGVREAAQQRQPGSPDPGRHPHGRHDRPGLRPRSMASRSGPSSRRPARPATIRTTPPTPRSCVCGTASRRSRTGRPGSRAWAPA